MTISQIANATNRAHTESKAMLHALCKDTLSVKIPKCIEDALSLIRMNMQDMSLTGKGIHVAVLTSHIYLYFFLK